MLCALAIQEPAAAPAPPISVAEQLSQRVARLATALSDEGASLHGGFQVFAKEVELGRDAAAKVQVVEYLNAESDVDAELERQVSVQAALRREKSSAEHWSASTREDSTLAYWQFNTGSEISSNLQNHFVSWAEPQAGFETLHIETKKGKRTAIRESHHYDDFLSHRNTLYRELKSDGEAILSLLAFSCNELAAQAAKGSRSASASERYRFELARKDQANWQAYTQIAFAQSRLLASDWLGLVERVVVQIEVDEHVLSVEIAQFDRHGHVLAQTQIDGMSERLLFRSLRHTQNRIGGNQACQMRTISMTRIGTRVAQSKFEEFWVGVKRGQVIDNRRTAEG